MLIGYAEVSLGLQMLSTSFLETISFICFHSQQVIKMQLPEGDTLLVLEFSYNQNSFFSARLFMGSGDQGRLVCCLTNKAPHACAAIALRARCILFKISSPLAFQA
jgi:hypothetical protein